MAIDWIKLHIATPDKPEVFKIADTLGIDPDAVLGKLIRVWIWADQQTVDGNAPNVTKSLLDRVTNVSGFADAMVSAGWLTQNSDGYAFPNFDRHNGKSGKNRALTYDRVRRSRAQKVKRKRNAHTVTASSSISSSSLKVSTSVENGSGRPKYSEEFNAFWAAFPTGRKKSKGAAWKSWNAVTKEVEAQILIDRASAYAKSDEGRGPFVKMPSTWLNQDCWSDDPEAWKDKCDSEGRPKKRSSEPIPTEVLLRGTYDGTTGFKPAPEDEARWGD